MTDKDNYLEIIESWLSYWMNQTQNSESDRANYFRRAFGVDANMRHHLAGKLAESLQARETALLKEIEELKADLVTLEAQFQLVDEAHERCVIARDEYKAKLAASEAEVERRRLLTLEMSE